MSGLSDYGEAQALIALLPEGTNRYIALFTVLPGEDGTGGTEASGSSYARKAHSSWVNDTSGDVTRRKNNGNITFAALTGSLSGIVGWGIYDALSSGNLIAFGPVLDSGGNEVTKNFVATDQPQFLDQELKIGLN